MEVLILGNKDLLKVLHLVLIFVIKKYELCDLLASKSENSFSLIYFSSTLISLKIKHGKEHAVDHQRQSHYCIICLNVLLCNGYFLKSTDTSFGKGSLKAILIQIRPVCFPFKLI